jgi:hypothetical protein
MATPNYEESDPGTIDGWGTRTVRGVLDKPVQRSAAPGEAGVRPAPGQHRRGNPHRTSSDDPVRRRRPWLGRVFD